ncbi:MAG: DUF2796 domain-containing protein [Gammaproteobacteria bacterium]|nr:DUF2796 domain-containing protein [Gammaproteobacteria bacterium]
MHFRVLFASVALALPLSALADDHQHSLGAHVHGLATLDIALENQRLELQLTSPAMNIVGFEYQPTTAADLQSVKTAQSNLSHAAELFVLSPAAQCRLTSVSIDNPLLTESDIHEHEHEHEHESQPTAQIAEHQHSDISAHYQYHCAKPARLNSIDLAGLFKQFSQTEKIQVQLIAGDHQQGAELSANNTLLSW